MGQTSTTTGRHRGGRLAAAVVILLVVTFVVLAWPRRWFNDDAFITFRYGQNIAGGHGFVWNITDPVPIEGSTSLGWTLLSALTEALHGNPLVVCQLVGLAAGVVGLVAVWRGGLRLGTPAAWAIAAPALLAGHRQYVLWSVSAMETRVATVLALLGTLALVAEVTSSARRRPWSGLAFLLGSIVRPETPLLHAAGGLGLLLAKPSRETLRRVALSGGIHAAGLIALTGWRLATFGKPLPNPFYVKVGGLQWARGWTYLLEFLDQYHAILWGLPFVVALWVLLRRRDPLAAAITTQIVAITVWIVAIGGGRWEFRFFDWILPAWAMLVAFGLFSLASPAGADRRRALARTFLAGGLAAALVVAQTSTLFQRFRSFDTMMSVEALHAAGRAMLVDGMKLAEILGPEDRIATGWAGAVPYATRAWHFDPWGLNHPDGGDWPFDPVGVLFHQRHATWEMLEEADVFFVDIFNQFLYRRPAPPRALLGKLRPWARDGSIVYCIELPGRRAPWYWIFASPQSRETIDRWLERHDLRLVYALPLLVGPLERARPELRSGSAKGRFRSAPGRLQGRRN